MRNLAPRLDTSGCLRYPAVHRVAENGSKSHSGWMQAHSQQQSPTYALLHKPCFAHGKAPVGARRSRKSSLMKHSRAQRILLACETCLGTGTPRAQQKQPHNEKKTAYHPKDCGCFVWDSTEMTALQHTREKRNQMLAQPSMLLSRAHTKPHKALKNTAMSELQQHHPLGSSQSIAGSRYTVCLGCCICNGACQCGWAATASGTAYYICCGCKLPVSILQGAWHSPSEGLQPTL